MTVLSAGIEKKRCRHLPSAVGMMAGTSSQKTKSKPSTESPPIPAGFAGNGWKICSAAGLAEGAYVEISAIVAMTMMMDSFTRALGIPQSPLPAPGDGEPTKYHPPGGQKGRGLGCTLGA